MSVDRVIGPRMGVLKPQDGVHQYPELDGDGAVLNLTTWAGETVEIAWYPSVDEYAATDRLLYGFFRTEAAATPAPDPVFDTTTASTTGPVAAAPARLSAQREFVRVTVPRAHPFLRIQAENAAGLCTVHHVEGPR